MVGSVLIQTFARVQMATLEPDARQVMIPCVTSVLSRVSWELELRFLILYMYCENHKFSVLGRQEVPLYFSGPRRGSLMAKVW